MFLATDRISQNLAKKKLNQPLLELEIKIQLLEFRLGKLLFEERRSIYVELAEAFNGNLLNCIINSGLCSVSHHMWLFGISFR